MRRDRGHQTVQVPKLAHNSLFELFRLSDGVGVTNSCDFDGLRDAREFPVTGERHAIKAIFQHSTPPSVHGLDDFARRAQN